MDRYENIFKKPADKYVGAIIPHSEYILQASKYISIELGISQSEAIKHIKQVLKEKSIINPDVRYFHREDNGDTVIKETTLTDYLKDVVDSKQILAPSFTAYDHPSVKKSLHSEFLGINVKLRAQDKQQAFQYKQQGDKEKEGFYDTMQKVRKIFNNSLSGAYGSPSTILYNQSAHYTLTSVTRSVASIGNAVSESIIAGNKLFRSPEVVINYITAVVTNVKMLAVEYCIRRFNLHVPTPEEVMEMIMYSARYYWEDPVMEEEILNYIRKLSDPQRVVVMYLNDLWHLKKYNEVFVKEMLTNLSRRKVNITEDIKYLKNAPEGIDIVARIICSEDIKGMKVDYKALEGTTTINALCSTAKYLLDQLNIYKPLIRTFFASDILPTGIAYVKDMMRDAIVLSDTDSTCGSYDKWVEWYYGETRFSPEAVALSSAVMLINTQAIDHNLKIFAKNMNVPDEDSDLLKMKNEFFWPVFITANVSKHYYADTTIQEGNIFKEPSLELKGVHLIASAANQKIVAKVHGMLKEINATVTNNEKLSIVKYITAVADMEREIIDMIKNDNIEVYTSAKIKPESAYKQDRTTSPYNKHLLWEEVFADKYGSPGDPMYMAIKVPLILDNARKTKEFINSIEDEDIKNRLNSFMAKYGKDRLATMVIPTSIAVNKGIPVEFKEVINIHNVVTNNLKVGYIMLESIGFFAKKDRMVCELGY